MTKIQALKKYLAILLLLTCSLRPAYYVGYYAYYQLNIDYFIKNYCSNTDKPQLQCNGKCYLMKQLSLTQAQNDTDAAAEATLTLAESFIPLFYTAPATAQFSPNTSMAKRPHFTYTAPHGFEPAHRLLRPPIALL